MNLVIGSKYLLDGDEQREVIAVRPAGSTQKLHDPRNDADEGFSPFLPPQDELVTVRDVGTGVEQDVQPHRLTALPTRDGNNTERQEIELDAPGEHESG